MKKLLTWITPKNSAGKDESMMELSEATSLAQQIKHHQVRSCLLTCNLN